MYEDAGRMARRFYEVALTFGMTDSDLPSEEALAEVFEELIKGDVVFPGPSLYADPSV